MNIQATLQKLNSINIKELKNIDFRQVKAILSDKTHILINAALVFATLIVIVNIFNGQKRQARDIQAQIPLYEEKLKLIEEGKAIKGEYEQFLNQLPGMIEDDRLIDKISDLAVSNNVQILSFAPPSEKDDPLVHLLTVELDISAESYDNLIHFLEDIENLPFTVKVSHVRTSLEASRSRPQPGGGAKNALQAHMEVNSVTLKK